MKKTLFPIFLLFFLIHVDVQAQHVGWCGTGTEANIAIKERLLANRARFANTAQIRTGETWAPIAVHVVTDNDGGNRVDIMKVYDMLCAVNEDYLPYGIQFYLHGGQVNLINSTSINSNPNTSTNPFAQSILVGNKVAGAINMFIVKDIPPTDGSVGNTLGFYQIALDYLVIQRDQVSAQKAETITHELGHLLSLPHPFLGWDSEPYDENTHGNPAPAVSPYSGVVGGTVPTELMNGSNCETAGDGICDTKPNYLFGFGYNGCNFVDGIMDPNGTIVDPQENNYMAYFIGCADEFTPMQADAMLDDINSRNIGSTQEFDQTEFAAAPNLVYPINDEQTPLFNVVGLDWDAVDGATGYIVEVDRTGSFTFDPSFKFVTGTYAEFEDVFDADKTYYWRVKPVKDGYYCGPVSVNGKFETGTTTSIDEIKEVLNYRISPNPLNTNEILNINMETNESFDAKIKLYSLSGQIIKEIDQTFGLGTTNYELSVAGLNQGMYLLSIESETGVLNEKIVVTR